jgi:hypothetical protein
MTIVDKSLFKPTPTFRARRKRVMARVQLHDAEGTAQDVMVRDISATGMSAVARSGAPDAQEIVTVTLPDGSSVWGMVRWVEGKAFGVEFDASSRQEPVAGVLER